MFTKAVYSVFLSMITAKIKSSTGAESDHFLFVLSEWSKGFNVSLLLESSIFKISASHFFFQLHAVCALRRFRGSNDHENVCALVKQNYVFG